MRAGAVVTADYAIAVDVSNSLGDYRPARRDNNRRRGRCQPGYAIDQNFPAGEGADCNSLAHAPAAPRHECGHHGGRPRSGVGNHQISVGIPARLALGEIPAPGGRAGADRAVAAPVAGMSEIDGSLSYNWQIGTYPGRNRAGLNQAVHADRPAGIGQDPANHSLSPAVRKDEGYPGGSRR